MAKNFRRILATTLVMSMLVSALPMQALAEETHDTITNGGVTTEITTTTTVTGGENGSPTVTVEIQKSESTGTTESGANVNGSGSSTTTTVTDSNNNTISSNSNSSSTTTSTTTDSATGTTTEVTTDVVTKNEVNADGSTYDYEKSFTISSTTDAEGNLLNQHWVEDGQEKSEKPIEVDNVTVTVPKTDVDDPATKETENSNTVTFGGEAGSTTGGDVKDGDDDTEYDQTTTTVTPGKVTVTTKDVDFNATTLKEVIDENGNVTYVEVIPEKIVDENGNVVQGTDLDYVHSVQKPVNGKNDNELFIWVYEGNRTEIPKEGEKIDVEEGYEYKYLGSGNTSQYLPIYLYGQPASPDEEPIFVDANGKKYYKHTQGSKEYDRVYIDGEWVDLESAVPGTFSVPQQFTLVDAATGELITAYCADVTTPTEKGYGYNIENLEDADYYTKEQAAMIRTIASNGYWGTASGEPGSLDSMKESLRNAKDSNGESIFTEDELALLTDGVALTATQMAIWTFSNKASDMHFFNMLYTKNGDSVTGEIASNTASGLVNWKASKEDSYTLLYKLYEYMIALPPTPAGEDAEQPTTVDTIINEKNFLKDMSVTVVEKKADHANNYDEDDTNDAYVTNLTFALVVKPSTENGDDLVVTVVDANGKEIARGRIAGTAAEDEKVLKPDDKGNYCFEGITMVEGDQNFKLNLSGVQYLKEGVYLYSSEVKTDAETNTDVSSQTLVGIASGKHSVDVTMDIVFELNVDEGVVATEHVWHHEGDPSYDPGEPTTLELDPPPAPQIFRLNNQDGLEEIPEEPVPLAAPVITGDNSAMWMAVVLFALFGMVAINLADKKRQHETF